MFAVLVLLSGVQIADVSQSHGWMQWLGVQGYVTEAQLGTVEQLVKETRADQLVQQILDQTMNYCRAYEANDQQAMSFAFQALQDARAKYFTLMGREYSQLMCTRSSLPSVPDTNK